MPTTRWRRCPGRPARRATGPGCPGTRCPRCHGRRGRRAGRTGPARAAAERRRADRRHAVRRARRRELAALGALARGALHRWPTRRSRRQAGSPSGHRSALRETMAPRPADRLGADGAQALPDQVRRPLHGHPVVRREPVDAGLRDGVPAPDAGLRPRPGGRDLRVLDLADPAHPGAGAPVAGAAVAQAGAQVVDRFGGTHLARCLPSCSGRGTATSCAGDWSSPPTAGTATRPRSWPAVMARLRRRAHARRLAEPAGRGARLRAAGRGRWPRRCRTATRSCPAHTLRALCPTSFDAIAAVRPGGLGGQLQRVTCTAGLNRPDVHAGAADHRLGRARRGDEAQQLGGRRRLVCAGQRQRRPPALRAQARAVERHQPPGGQVAPRPRSRRRGRRPLPRRGLLQRGRVALEDPLLLLGDAEPAQHRGHHAVGLDRGRAEVPALAPELRRWSACVPASGCSGPATARTRRGGTAAAPATSSGAARRGPDRDVDRAGGEQRGELAPASWTLSSTSRSSARLANRSISPGAACSANRFDDATRSTRGPWPAWLTSRTVRSWRPRISTARLASRSPPGVNARPERCG